MLAKYKEKLKTLEAEYNTQAGAKQSLEQDRAELTQDIQFLKETNETYEKTRILLQKTATDARASAKKRLEETVTDALKYVFGQDFEFIIELKESRGRAEAEFYVESDFGGERVRVKPEDARGGGVVDIISIALRVALVQIYNNPAIKGPIILDEPGKHVSADYTMKLANFLKQINNTFDRQIILSTHQQDLANIADTAHEVNIKGGVSHVTTVASDTDGEA